MLHIFSVIIGLCVFEIITSIDNVVVSGSILKTVDEKFKRFYLLWGLIFAIFVVRGLLPFIIVMIANPDLSVYQVLTVLFTKNQLVENSLNSSKTYLLLGGGVYLFLTFLSWLFLEEKKYCFHTEHFIHRQAVWFYSAFAIFYTFVIYMSLQIEPKLALAASFGMTAFFVADGIKKNAQEKEKDMVQANASGWSKIIYLEVMDLSFSIDGVIGAFAFTLSIPLIVLGMGLGAFFIRHLTIRNINTISKYVYLKNGAMYSIGLLSFFMILESFGSQYPNWMTTLNTLILLSVFFYLSYKEIIKLKLLKI